MQINNPRKSDCRAIQGRDANVLVCSIASYDASSRSNCHLPHPFVCCAVGKATSSYQFMYSMENQSFGLVAKHAQKEEAVRHQPREMCSVGQHLPHESGATFGSQFGKDHFFR